MASADDNSFRDYHLLEPPAFTRRSAVGIGAAVILLSLLGLASDAIAVLLAAGCVSLLLLPWAGWISLGFFTVTAGLCGVLDYMPVSLGLFNVYTSDFILVVYAWMIVHIWYDRTTRGQTVHRSQNEKGLMLLWFAWAVLGLFFVFYGYYIQHLRFDRVFGDFRRATIYSMAFFIPLLFPYTEKQIRNVTWMIAGSGLIVIGVGLYRLLTGGAARVDENYETGHLAVRLMSMAETMTLAGLLSLLTLFLATGKANLARVAAFAVIGVTSTLLVLSGFRLAMAFVVIVPVLAVGFLAWSRGESPVRLVKMLGLLAVAAIPIVLVAMVLLPDQFQKMILDLQLRLVNENIQGGFRTWTYAAAVKEFFESPVIGKGFGYYIVVPLRNQLGLFDYIEMNNPHNMFLAVMYQTGALGLLPFFAFHISFFVLAMRWTREIVEEYHHLYVTLLVTYLCYLGYMSLQPYVSSQFILIYLIMGFMVRIARHQKPLPQRPGKPTPAAQPIAVE